MPHDAVTKYLITLLCFAYYFYLHFISTYNIMFLCNSRTLLTHKEHNFPIFLRIKWKWRLLDVSKEFGIVRPNFNLVIMSNISPTPEIFHLKHTFEH